jgi:hypothetical protein
MMAAFWLIFAFGVLLLAGFLILRAVDRDRRLGLGPVSGAAVAFVAGLGVVSLQMFFYSLISIPFSAFAVAAPWLVIALGALGVVFASWRGRGRGLAALFSECSGCCASLCRGLSRGGGGGGGLPCWASLLLMVVIASQVAYVFSYATLLPVNGWDAWAIWFLKARAFFIDGGVNPSFLTDPAYGYGHPDYPLLVPLSVAWVYTAVGAATESFAKLLWPMQFVSLLLIFNWGVRRATGSVGTSLLFTALLSITPVLIVHASGVPAVMGGLHSGDFAGYADLMLSLCFLASGVFLFLFFREGAGGRGEDRGGNGGGYLIISALMLGCAAWTKNEGLTFAALAVLLVIVHSASASRSWRRPASLYPVVTAVLVVCVFVLPWFAFKSYLGLGSDLSGGLGMAGIMTNSARLGAVVSAFSDYLFTRPMLYGLVWYIYPLSAIINWRGTLSRPINILNLLLIGQLAVYAFVYVITPADLAWHIGTSMGRLVLHLTPLALFIAALNTDGFLKRISCRRGE